ncbi:MAG: AAA family ATPase [Candidatus Zixiibacteriota bacterium]
MITRIVITGGPASGKTDFFERLKKIPDFKEFAFLDELARWLLKSRPSLREDPLELHRQIYLAQVARENELAGRSFIADRGTVDTRAYVPEIFKLVGTTREKEYRRYDAVIQLQTSAVLGADFFIPDGIRRESVAQALELEKKLIKNWGNHPVYYYVNAENDPELKFDKFLKLLYDIIENRFK